MTGATAGHLHLRSIGLREANQFVRTVHPHQGYVRDHKFALAIDDTAGVRRGVAIAGRPTVRILDTGWHLEVLRVATDGTPDTSSLLYAAVAHAGITIGYRRQDILAHTHANEPGTSLRAAGWVPVATTTGASWDRPARHRTDQPPTADTIRWHAAPPTVAPLPRGAQP